MSWIDSLALKIRRGDSALYRGLKRLYFGIAAPPGLRFPRLLKPVGRALYSVHFLVIVFFRSLRLAFYTSPLFQARCVSVGKNLRLDGKMPFVEGHTEIILGDNVSLGGNVSMASGRVHDHPRLVIGDRTHVGWNVMFSVNQEIVIEGDVFISYDCRISDNDGHPRDALRRARHEPPDARDVKPVRICRYAWIGNGAHIHKGVTIGEGAIIGSNSVVMRSVPAYSIAFGNPAEVYVRNINQKTPQP